MTTKSKYTHKELLTESRKIMERDPDAWAEAVLGSAVDQGRHIIAGALPPLVHATFVEFQRVDAATPTALVLLAMLMQAARDIDEPEVRITDDAVIALVRAVLELPSLADATEEVVAQERKKTSS